MSRVQALEVEVASMEPRVVGREVPGIPSGYACPECHGVLWEIGEADFARFRCRVGHAYSMETLLAEQGTGLDAALWAAFRALEERAALTGRMAQRMRSRGQATLEARYRTQAGEAERDAALIRGVLLGGSVDGPTVERGEAEESTAG